MSIRRPPFGQVAPERVTRRHFLRGSGGLVLGLPALASLDAWGAPNPAPKRFIGVYHPNGVYTPDWFPTAGTRETDFTLNSTHAALAPWKEHLLLTRGLDMKVALVGPGEQHQRGIGAFLTGAKLAEGSFLGNDGTKAGYARGPSIDQSLVKLIGAGTRHPSLQLGVHTALANVAGCVSYAGENLPLLPQNDPRLTFRTLFMDAHTAPSELVSLRARRRSVLDAVKEQVRSLQKTVSTSDRQRLEAHLDHIRALERRVTELPPGVCVVPADPGALDYATEAQVPVVTRLQVELLLLAMQCDLTRVATLMFSDALNHMALPHLQISADLHNLTHYGDADPARKQVGKRDAWTAEVIASLLGGLEAIREADGSNALQHSLVFWGSDVSRGNVHAHDDMPFLLAGGGAGFRMGRYVKWNGAFHNDLLVSILNGFGGTFTQFGDPEFCAGPLPSLT
jgi:hypothetical protein